MRTFTKLAVARVGISDGKWVNNAIGNNQPFMGNLVPAQMWKHYAWYVDAFRGSIWHFEDGQLQKYEPSLFQGSFLPWYALSLDYIKIELSQSTVRVHRCSNPG